VQVVLRKRERTVNFGRKKDVLRRKGQVEKEEEKEKGKIERKRWL